MRAVDHEGEVLEAVVTKRRDKSAALKLLKKLIRRFGNPETPEIIVTDKLRSYGAAMKEMGISGHECEGRWINNRVENLLRGPSVLTNRCDEENERCSVSG